MLSHNVKNIQTDNFEGPLELLLYLINKQGIDIREVKIAPITDAFLSYIETIEMMDLNAAGDFILMASTLCYLKSKELLPSVETDKDLPPEQDPEEIRKELAQRLAEYKRFKDASARLNQHPILNRDTFARLTVIEDVPRKAKTQLDSFGLLKIFQKLIQSQLEKPPEHIIEKSSYSIKEVSEWILNKLKNGPVLLTDLLQLMDTKPDRIIVFLALLELGRFNYIDVIQESHLSSIQIIPVFQGTVPTINLEAEVS